MTMKLHIFGDSFASDISPGTWPHTLANLLGIANIVGYGAPGSSLFYTLTQINDADISADDVAVVVITQRGRLYFNKAPHYPNYSSAKKSLSGDYRSKAAEQYYIHLQEDAFDKYVHTYLIKDVYDALSNRCKKFVLVMGFPDTPPAAESLDSPPLLKIVQYQNNLKSIDEIDSKYNLRNHLTEYNQTVLANGLSDHLLGKQPVIPISYFKTI